MKKVNVDPKGLCPRCNEPWNIHDCPNPQGAIAEVDSPPVGNGHPDFDLLLDVIAMKYRHQADHDNSETDDWMGAGMTLAYNEALGDIVRICTSDWNKDFEVKKLKELASLNAGWVNDWLMQEIGKK